MNRPVALTIAASLVIVLVALAGYLVGSSSTAKSAPDLPESQTLSACIKENIQLLRIKEVDRPTLIYLTNVCYSQVHAQGLLSDFQLRRHKFLQQYYAEKVILWMVVSITISGVLLSGLQLLVSYQLAVAGRGQFGESGELSLEKDRVSLKSSITGLFILIVSFAFFAVFVFEIYKIREVNVDPTESQQSLANPLGPGGISPPPPQKKPNEGESKKSAR